jgi:hypothetical protein
VSNCRVPVLGVFVVGVTNWSGEGLGLKSLGMVSICRRSNPCGGCSPLPFIDARGGAQGERKYKVQCLGAGMSHRASLSTRHIETELRCLIVGAAKWPGEAVHSRTLGASFE